MADTRARDARLLAGLTQGDVAGRAKVSRQAMYAIECGRARPSVDVAIAIAEAVGSSVAALFGAPRRAEGVRGAALVGPTPRGPVVLGRVGRRWVAHGDPSRGERAADAWCSTGKGGDVEWLHPREEIASRLLVAGCAPALGVVASRLDDGRRRATWLPWSSQRALDAVERETVHVAGVHLGDGTDTEARAAKHGLVVVTLASWPVGLAFRQADARVRGAGDLGRRNLRIAVRERGAGARRLLDRTLKVVGATVRGRGVAVGSHDEAVHAVSLGAADVCVTGVDIAKRHDLGFVQLAEDRFDLVMREATFRDPRLARLLDVVASGVARREMELRGYGTAQSGRRVL